MEQKKEDLRVQKTKANIKETFLTLLETKSLHKLRVREILDNAKINRATFYKYYHDKYDLAAQCAAECIEAITPFIDKRFNTQNNTQETQSTILSIYNYLQANRRTLLLLWENEGDELHLYRDMEALLRKHCLIHINNTTIENPEFKDYLATLYASLVMTTIKWHLEQNSQIDIQRLFSYVNTTVQNNLL